LSDEIVKLAKKSHNIANGNFFQIESHLI